MLSLLASDVLQKCLVMKVKFSFQTKCKLVRMDQGRIEVNLIKQCFNT